MRIAGSAGAAGREIRLPGAVLAGKLNILFVIGDLDIGGAERHLSQILPLLARKGFRPLVYTLTHKGSLAPSLTAGGIDVVAPPFAMAMRRLPPFVRPLVFLPVTTAALLWMMRRYKPDIVHFFLPAAYLLGGLCSLVTRVPLRVMSRRSLNHYQRGHPVLKRLELWLHRRMDAVLANSQAVLAQLIEEGVPRHRLGLIYNGIDVVPYPSLQDKTAGRSTLHIDNNALTITVVANLIAYKGHRDLLQSLAIVSPQLSVNWVLLCVGRDEGIGSSLRDLQDKLGIGKQVRWLGERTDVTALLSLTDIGVLCSHQEGFSNTVLEAMAANVPMIVTDVGGNKEAVIDGVTGVVVPPRNPEALGGAILKLASDPGLRRQMGAAARKRVQQVFPISRCAVSYARLYRGFLERKPYPIEETLQRPS